MKRYILLPVVLLAYLVVMAYFTYPGRTHAGLSYTQYYVSIGVTIVIIAVLSYFLKKKDDHKKKCRE